MNFVVFRSFLFARKRGKYSKNHETAQAEVQENLNLAPLEYQIALRLRRAMHLLASSNVPIAQIAEETGFKSASYFSKFFHERAGLSPSAYRAKSSTAKS